MSPASRGSTPLIILYALTAFAAAFLIFSIQPILGKRLLPILGGSPIVWGVCMVFFQGMLLLGHLYAHLVATQLRVRAQLGVQAALLTAAVFFLPPDVPEGFMPTLVVGQPLLWLLAALAVSCGPALFVISSTAPLMQSWFARMAPQRADGSVYSPYSLYIASNAGSLTALLSYPFLIEPMLRLDQQLGLWALGYGLVALLIVWTAAKLWQKNPEPGDREKITVPKAAYSWILLALIPSSLMLGITTYITTDLASMPLLWLVPLALFLVAYIIAFSSHAGRILPALQRWLPLIMVASLMMFFVDERRFLWFSMGWHLISFFLVTLCCHCRLAQSKPEPKHLTAFYLCLALGGLLGGVFNTFVAPVIFNTTAEYPLMIALAILSCAVPAKRFSTMNIHWRIALGCAAVIFGSTVMLFSLGLTEVESFNNLAKAAEDLAGIPTLRASLVFAVPLLLCLLLGKIRPTLAGASLIGAVFIALSYDTTGSMIFRERSVFGIISVSRHELFSTYSLVHGHTMHGEQRRSPVEAQFEPQSYYHREGSLGHVFTALNQRVPNPRIGIIGLGAGAIAAYGTFKTAMTFYELDPRMEALARNPRYFTYVTDCLERSCGLKIVIGDGRLNMERSEESYDLIIVDAFNSDSVPVHLLTVEALKIYFEKLNPGGVIAFHISNRFVNLEPVLQNLAEAAGLRYAIRYQEELPYIGVSASRWAVLAREAGDFETIVRRDDKWGISPDRKEVAIWRDDYSNVARSFVWR